MKHTLFSLLLISLPCLLTAQDDTIADSLLNAKIERLMELSGSRNQFGTVINQMIDMQKANPIYTDILPDEFWSEFKKETMETGYEMLLPEMITIYRAHMTEEEIDHQIAYFSSPLTQQIVAKQPMMMQASMEVGGRWGAQLGEDIVRRLTEATKDRN